MKWDRSNTLALAKTSCTTCHGLGMYVSRREERVCRCVLRQIFRIVFDRFRQCAEQQKHIGVSQAYKESNPRGHDSKVSYGRKREEFMADFCLVSKRALSAFDHQIFRFHFLLGADWKMCCHRLKIDRGTFFHAVYRIEEALGQTFAELEPYALYPIDEYFGTVIRSARPTPPTPPAVINKPIAAMRIAECFHEALQKQFPIPIQDPTFIERAAKESREAILDDPRRDPLPLAA